MNMEDEGWVDRVMLVAFVIVGGVAAPWLVPLLVPGFPAETMEHAVHLTRIVLPAQLAFLVGGVVAATRAMSSRTRRMAGELPT